MNWTHIITQIFEIVIFPLLGVGTVYLISLIRAKNQELKENQNQIAYYKYLDMLERTIENCVLATTQTYVSTLKKEGKFDKDAQVIAFQKTYDSVMKVLTKDAKEFLETVIGDLEIYVSEKIEAEVIKNKN